MMRAKAFGRNARARTLFIFLIFLPRAVLTSKEFNLDVALVHGAGRG